MKNHQRTYSALRHLFALALAASLALPVASTAASIALATSPLATSTTSSVLPNVTFILDNSGSMDWSYMPDDANDFNGNYGFPSSQCNGVYYDPDATYLPPVDASGASYADASFTAAWTDGFDTAAGTTNLSTGYRPTSSYTTGSAFYYAYSGTQSTSDKKDYYNQNSIFYRECNSAIGSTTAIDGTNPVNTVFTKRRLNTSETTTITVSGSTTTATSASSITVNGVELMSGTSASSTSTNTVAANIAALITLNGYSATASGSTVTITGPISAANFTPVITYTGSMTLTPDVFPDTTAAKLTNFANWYSFYRTRMLMMKTAAGRAFITLDSHYRVGFMSINTNSDFLNLAPFDSAQKSLWYAKLYADVTNGSTPLREALAKAGRLYAGKLTLSGVTVNDPVQYSCQQNFTILSTDGFWNGNAGYKVDGSTAVGNQDGSAERPMYDGSQISKTSTQIRQSQTQTTQQTSSLQGTLSKVLMRCNNTAAACGTAPATGVANANWSVVTSGSCNTLTSVQCAIVSGLSGTYNVANTCKTSASITSGTGPGTATVTITNSNNAVVRRVRGDGNNGTDMLSGNTSSSSTDSTVASRIASKINDCTNGTTGSCDVSGNSATVSGNVVTISGPDVSSALTVSLNSGSATFDIVYTPGGPSYTLSNADSNGKIYSSCAYSAWSAPALTASCTIVNQSSTPNNTSVVTASQCTTTTVQSPTLVASCTAGNSGAPDYYQTVCTPTTTVTNNVSSCSPQAASSANSYTTVTCTAGTGGTSDTLADVAMYYYQTDLRTTALGNCTGAMGAGVDVCANNVFKTDTDSNVAQHMATFTLGMGASGKMKYSPSYLSDTSGDFYSIKEPPATADSTATPPICSWQANGTTCNWPIPGSSLPENIDDLWHAAVNGHGQYFSATNPASLSTGLSNALAAIAARKGSSAAAATSTLNPVAGNNYAYVASYTTVKWQGNLEARTINVNTGVISESASWCVESIVAGNCPAPNSVVADSSGGSTVYNCVTAGATAGTCAAPGVFDVATSECRTPMATSCTGTMPGMVDANSDTRTIYTANSTGTALINFDSAYAIANPTDFSAAHINTLSQWPSLTATQKTAAEGVNLINFLRGQTAYEDRAINLVGAVDNRLYRYRESTLGDALESQPIFIAKPVFSYADPGYSEFATAEAGRVGTVYMGTNDGMLHAFSALAEGSVPGGTERWAYVPSMVITNMWKLADKDYATQHTNFVNGSPVISDVCTANCTDSATAVWRTILVGGLNAGGRGYYALDITVPATPTLLWEFTTADDSDLGYSYGVPVITAKSDGTWVVLVTSGYNNTSPGNGQGYLYVLDAATGAIISKLGTGVGSTATPSGLSKISAWSDAPASNRATYVYGGDLLGNVWRFDINTAGAPLLFATLLDPSGNPQPITTTPVLGKIGGKRIIFIGTGKYLETSDLTDTQVQSLYAIKDDNATATLSNPAGSPRNSTTLVQQTLTEVSGTRTASSNPVNFNTGRGWYVDFPDSGERSNIESRLVQGILLVATIVPSNSVCSPGGYGWLNFFDYQTGGPIDSSGIASVRYNNSIVGINVLYINGAPVIETVTSNNPTPTVDPNVPIPPTKTGFIGKRVLWRELNQ